jgi:hypothetical protein
MDEQANNTDDSALPDGARRRFGLRGLGASGLLLTLACKPVLGASRARMSPSGFLSANQSGHGPISGSWRHGSGPDYWRTSSVWPIPQSTRFAHVFSAAPATIYDSLTLLEMVNGHPQDTAELGMHLTAALLSSRSGWTDFLPEATILAMFLEWRTRGYFAPTANVQWDAVEIVKYLKATMQTIGGSFKQQG